MGVGNRPKALERRFRGLQLESGRFLVALSPVGLGQEHTGASGFKGGVHLLPQAYALAQALQGSPGIPFHQGEGPARAGSAGLQGCRAKRPSDGVHLVRRGARGFQVSRRQRDLHLSGQQTGAAEPVRWPVREGAPDG